MLSFFYELTVHRKKTAFRESDLIKSYDRIFMSFDLPKNEAKAVAQEVESHTGLIVAIGSGTYQFSHLSLQEYLCAEYLVRSPFSELRERYFNEYPAPLAISVALAPDSAKWFTHLVLEMKKISDGLSAHIFLDRLMLERPSFVPSAFLGYGAYEILNMLDGNHQATSENFLNLSSVNRSVHMFLKNYNKYPNSLRLKNKVEEFFAGSTVRMPPYVDRPSVRYGIL